MEKRYYANPETPIPEDLPPLAQIILAIVAEHPGWTKQQIFEEYMRQAGLIRRSNAH